ncbi:hypothetical protein M2283_010212 [Streptomyces pseudovenezuelae]|uniref:Uncharacterized protein n=1 Tax=Streptomyces pseudovenezuelae TaxID=67350 RepID=A0ABT6M2T2_9ACTN|nr:hypothetical protein [Streptomyces pseudovenezuelae]
MFMIHVPGQQQDFDQGLGAFPVVVGRPGRRQPGVMHGREPACRAGLLQSCRAGKRARLTDQGLQVVVQDQTGATLGAQPLVPGDFPAVVEDDQFGGVQQHAQSLSDQPHRHRVPVGADRDLPVAVDPRGEPTARLERLDGQRLQPGPLDGEVLTDRLRTRPDAPTLVLQVPPLDHLVQLGEGGDLGDRDEVVAAEVADLALDSALLMGAFDVRAAVEALDAPVRTKGDPPLGFRPLPREPQDLGDRRLQVVVAHLAAPHPAQHVQRVDMAFEERLLAAGSGHPVHRLARVRQPQREQIAAGGHPRQHDMDVAEVDLRLVTGYVGLRDEHLLRPAAGLPPDLLAPHRDVGTDHLIRDAGRPVLVQQPVEDPLHGVLLLRRRVEVGLQHPVDHRLVGIQPARTRRLLLAGLGPVRVQRSADRPPGHPVLALQRAHRQTSTVVTVDRRVQLNLARRHAHPGPQREKHADRPTARPQRPSKLGDITLHGTQVPPVLDNERLP